MIYRRATFTIDWKIDWPGSDLLGPTKFSKYFVTAYDNVPYHWRVEVGKGATLNKMEFFLTLDDRPLEQMYGVIATIAAEESGHSFSNPYVDPTFIRGQAQLLYFIDMSNNNAFQAGRSF